MDYVFYKFYAWFSGQSFLTFGAFPRNVIPSFVSFLYSGRLKSFCIDIGQILARFTNTLHVSVSISVQVLDIGKTYQFNTRWLLYHQSFAILVGSKPLTLLHAVSPPLSPSALVHKSSKILHWHPWGFIKSVADFLSFQSGHLSLPATAAAPCIY